MSGPDAAPYFSRLAGRPLRGLLLDMDGTLTRPVLDFEAIRREIGIPAGHTILEYLDAHATPAERARADEIIIRHEETAAARAEANHGFPAFHEWLLGAASDRPRVGVITRNCRSATDRTLAVLGLPVDHCVTREDAPPKPDPAGMHQAMAALGVAPEETAVVGDFHFDILAGRAAGVAMTVFVSNRRSPVPDTGSADAVIDDLSDLPALLR